MYGQSGEQVMAEASVPEFDFASVKVLIVEDNDFVRFTLKKYLTGYGVKDVVEAINGEEGKNTLSIKPDIVICDIHMNPGDGFDFLNHVRSRATSENKLPFIFLTGNANAELVQKASDTGVDAYLLKPITAAALKSKMIDLLTRPVDQETDSVEKVWAFFTPGTLSDKCREIATLRGAGNTPLFEGEIRWRVTLLAEGKALKGTAESLDLACSDIQSCLKSLSGEHTGETEIDCSIEPADYTVL